MWTGPVDSVLGGRRMIIGSDFPGPGSRTWRPSPVLIALGVVAACAAVVWVVFRSNPMDRRPAWTAGDQVRRSATGAVVAGPRDSQRDLQPAGPCQHHPRYRPGGRGSAGLRPHRPGRRPD